MSQKSSDNDNTSVFDYSDDCSRVKEQKSISPSRGFEEDNLSEKDTTKPTNSNEDDELSSNHTFSTATAQKHVFATVKTSMGLHEIDLTPPAILLEEHQQALYKNTIKETKTANNDADSYIRKCVEIIALTRIVYGDKTYLKLAEAHLNLARAYWELKAHANQTLYHSELALQMLEKFHRDNRALSSHVEEQETLWCDLSIGARYYHGKSLAVLERLQEAEMQFVTAEQLLEECKKICQNFHVKHVNWQISLCSALANLYITSNQVQKAERSLEKALQLLEAENESEKHSEKLLRLCWDRMRLEIGKGATGNHEYSLRLAKNAYSIAKERFEDDNEEVADAAKFLAEAYFARGADGDEEYVESYLNEAISCYQLSLGHSHRKTLTAQQDLAKHLVNCGHIQEAITILCACEPLITEAYGEMSKQTSTVHKLLATYFLRLGNTMESSKHLKKSLEVESILRGKSHRAVDAAEKALFLLKQHSNSKMPAHMVGYQLGTRCMGRPSEK